jgi:hypothetical protein
MPEGRQRGSTRANNHVVRIQASYVAVLPFVVLARPSQGRIGCRFKLTGQAESGAEDGGGHTPDRR